MTESQIKSVVEEVRRQLGANAADTEVKSVAMEAIRKMEDGDTRHVDVHAGQTEGRIIVTAFGKNQTGVISGISQTLTDCRCDIHDVSQKIMQEFFTLMMIVDIRNAICPFGIIKNKLGETSQRLGIRILAQHEDVFKTMHRI